MSLMAATEGEDYIIVSGAIIHASPAPISLTESRTVQYETILMRARGGPEEPHHVYEFGGGRKSFWSNFEELGIYGKPYRIINGEVVYIPDPDLIPQRK
jgi:hypothetical protein